MRLIFIPGSGSTKESWYYQTKYFKDSEGMDLPGHPEGKPCTSMEGYVEWMRGYIHGRGYSDVVLGGSSFGGGVALLYGLKYPEELKALILIGTGARLRVHPMYLQECQEGIKDKATWTKNQMESFYAAVDPEVKKILMEKGVTAGPAVTLNDLLCCDKFDIINQVQEIKLPTLVLCGSQDEMTPVKYSQYLAGKIEGARLVIIEGAGHGVAMEKPNEVNRAIEEFLKGLISLDYG